MELCSSLSSLYSSRWLLQPGTAPCLDGQRNSGLSIWRERLTRWGRFMARLSRRKFATCSSAGKKTWKRLIGSRRKFSSRISSKRRISSLLSNAGRRAFSMKSAASPTEPAWISTPCTLISSSTRYGLSMMT